MQLNYIILAHKNPNQILRLIERLNGKDVSFYIHIDKGSAIIPFKEILKSFKNIYFADETERVNIIWGDFSMVKATLNLIKALLSKNPKGYAILLSGQDYPIKSNSYISTFFKTNNGLNFMSYESLPIKKHNWFDDGMGRIEFYHFHPDKGNKDDIVIPPIFNKKFFRKRTIKQIFRLIFSKHWYKILLIFKKRKFPNGLPFYGGSQWWAFPIKTLEQISDFIKSNPQYVAFFKYTQVPDEIFFQSLVCSIIPENIISDKITHDKWSKDNVFSPLTLTSNDLEELKNLNELFARKFDIDLDENILNELDKIT